MSLTSTQGVVNSGFFRITVTSNVAVASMVMTPDSGTTQQCLGSSSCLFRLPNVANGETPWRLGSTHSVLVTAYTATGVEIERRSFGLIKGLNRDVDGDGRPDNAVSAYFSGSAGAVEVFTDYPAGSGSSRYDLSVPVGSEQFGFALAFVGDVNGDGLGDLAIGDNKFNATNDGAVFLYAGNSGGTPTEILAKRFVGAAPNDEVGNAVVALGDVDDDGLDDFAVAAANYSASEGRVYIFHGDTNSAVGFTSTDFGPPNVANTGNFGASLAALFDLNGDGRTELCVGEPDETLANVYCYRGIANGFDSIPVTLSKANGTGFGVAMASAGDANGDGYDDVIIGMPLYNNGGTLTGAALIYYGAEDVSNALNLSTSATLSDATLNSNAYMGLAVTGADLNGDGYGDVVVGAPLTTIGGHANTGKVFIYYGEAAGITAASVPTTLTLAGGASDASALFGKSVSATVDLYNDGTPDLFVGAPGSDNSVPADAGVAYRYETNYSGVLTGNITFISESTAVASAGFGHDID